MLPQWPDKNKIKIYQFMIKLFKSPAVSDKDITMLALKPLSAIICRIFQNDYYCSICLTFQILNLSKVNELFQYKYGFVILTIHIWLFVLLKPRQIDCSFEHSWIEMSGLMKEDIAHLWFYLVVKLFSIFGFS